MDGIDRLIAGLVEDAERAKDAGAGVTDAQIEAAARSMAARGFLPARGGEETYRTLATWVATVRAGLATRGLLLWGEPGRGKTLFLGKFCRAARTVRALQIAELYQEWGRARVLNWLAEDQLDIVPEDYYQLAIDDLGAEPTGKRFGETTEILADAVDQRYRQWQRRGWAGATFLSTNLSPDQLADRYGARTASRIAEMCAVINLTGPDWRMR
ncbi:MAG: hypothetical protein BWZ02_03060 [Lentisphaerae bacterium ADurb.BinA184]|nr:MAG: hypothetical protein BWZ02_03060 [Lentisphaerae bacterium ADurb.BinA184]